MKQQKTPRLGGIATVLAVVMLAGCASSSRPVIEGGRSAVAPMPLTAAHEAVAVIYRKPDAAATPAVIYVNDQIVGSLRPGAYAQTTVCPGDKIGVAPAIEGRTQPPASQAIEVAGGGTAYLQVDQSSAGTLAAKMVEPGKARQELSGEWRQSYLVSRYQARCAPVKVAAPPPPPPPVVLERVQLQTDALFAFGRSNIEDIQPGGRQALEDLARRIQEKGVRVDRLRIVGHADRLGNPLANQQLSLARALTVQQYLQQNGLKLAMDTQGRGSDEPVTRDCKGTRATPQLVACLQPDRRVDVELLGQSERSAAR